MDAETPGFAGRPGAGRILLIAHSWHDSFAFADMKLKAIEFFTLVLAALVMGVFWGTWFTLTRSLPDAAAYIRPRSHSILFLSY